jgi:hypothetical protein
MRRLVEWDEAQHRAHPLVMDLLEVIACLLVALGMLLAVMP